MDFHVPPPNHTLHWYGYIHYLLYTHTTQEVEFCRADGQGQLTMSKCPLILHNSSQTPTDLLQEATSDSVNLFRWKEFITQLPVSHFEDNLKLSELIVFEDDEEQMQNKCRQLGHNQMESVRRRGTFTLPNLHTGIDEQWQLSNLIIKGSQVAYEEFLDGVGFGLRFVVVYVIDLVECFKKSVGGVCNQLRAVIDLPLGLTTTECVGLEQKIASERSKYLVAELKCPKSTHLPTLARWIRQEVNKIHTSHIYLINSNFPPIPYKFTTPNGLQIDLTLLDNHTQQIIQPRLERILEKCNRMDGWFLDFRESVVDLGELVANERVLEEYLRRLCEEVREDEEIKQRGLGEVLVEQVGFWRAMGSASDLQQKFTLPTYLHSELKKAQNSHPLLSRDPHWLKKYLKTKETQFLTNNKHEIYETTLKTLAKQNLKQSHYLLKRDYNFVKNIEPILRRELINQRQPSKVFKHANYTVTSSYPFWRVINIIFRTIHYYKLIVTTFLIKTPLESQLSIKTIYEKSDSDNYRTIRGTISKLRKRLNNVNSFKKWLVCVGVVICLLLWPVVVLVANGVCLVVGVGAVVIAPILSLTHWLCCIIIKDVDGSGIIFPVGQITFLLLYNVLSCFISLVLICLCPVATFIILIATTTTYHLRLNYDRLTYKLLIKNREKIPHQFVRKLKQPTVYSLSVNQALTLLIARIELEELSLFYNKLINKLNEPVVKYEEFFDKYLKQFGCRLSENSGGFYSDLVNEVFLIKSELDSLISNKKLKLFVNIPRGKVVIRDFNLFTRKAYNYVLKSYTNLIRDYGLINYFNKRGLVDGDYRELCRSVIVEIFGVDVLYGEADGLIVGGSGGSMGSVDVEESSVKSMKMSRVEWKCACPYLSVGVFGVGQCVTPLHPIHVCGLVLNRDYDEGIDLEDGALRAVLDALQNTTHPQQLINQNCVALPYSTSV